MDFDYDDAKVEEDAAIALVDRDLEALIASTLAHIDNAETRLSTLVL